MNKIINKNVLTGTIRWDCWAGDTGASPASLETERSLGPSKYHYRVPFYGKELSDNSVIARYTTQKVMDKEIEHAHDAGLDYWAFLYYAENSGLDLAHKLYLSSKYNENIKFCMIMQPGNLTDETIEKLIKWFKMKNYQRVCGERPLLYFFSSKGLERSIIDRLKERVIESGLLTPYMVLMCQASNTDDIEGLGLDAASAYCSFGNDGESYRTLADKDVSGWNNLRDKGFKVIPWVTAGWDNRPRNDNKMTWIKGEATWAQYASPEELANHLKKAIGWTQQDTTGSAEAGAVLIYAWNEFDEGGWVCPTLYFGADRLNAISKVLGGKRLEYHDPSGTLGVDLVSGKKVKLIAKEKDCFVYELTLGNKCRINRVVLREHTHQSITSYRIIHPSDNGNVILYEDTTAGVYTIASFREVETDKIIIEAISALDAGPIIDRIEIYYKPELILPDKGLMCEWKFEDNLYDTIGSRHAKSNGKVQYSDGIKGSCLLIDGKSPSPIVFDTQGRHSAPIDDMDEFTVSLWVNVRSIPSDSGIILGKKDNDCAHQDYGLYIDSKGIITFGISTEYNKFGEYGTLCSAKSRLNTGLWYNIAGIYNGREISLYINGHLDSVCKAVLSGKAALSGKIQNSKGCLKFGADNTSGFAFKIDEVKIFNRALNANEVSKL